MTEINKLFYKYGARLTEGTAEMFYDRVYADEKLNPFFEKVDKASMQEHMVKFLTDLTGGPSEYEGRDMKTAHAALKISGQHFGLVAEHIYESLLEAGISEEDAKALLGAVENLKKHIVT